MIIGLSDAVASLKPHTNFSSNKNRIVAWDISEEKTGEVQPTEEEIEAEIIRLQAEYDAQEYARNRATAYPAIADQLDEIYHNGIDSWKAVIKVTKDKYPKG